MEPFRFSAHNAFRNRHADLARLDDWWSGRDRNAVALYGRRRVGKSWLFREFAHGKEAIVLVAARRAETPQLELFADQLAPVLGVRPSIRDIPELFKTLYEAGRDRKLLVVIDEFPYLLPTREDARAQVLTGIQAVMEERDASQLKLILCGSYISQMEGLLSGPLRGRLTGVSVEPLAFADACHFMDPKLGAVELIERFAVTGGMTLYLDELGRAKGLRSGVCSRVLDHRGPLFNDPREVIDEQLRAPGVYYSVLEELATGAKGIGELGSVMGMRAAELQKYLDALRDMRFIDRRAPLGRPDGETRGFQYFLADDFIRYWFRFVVRAQEDLKAGLAPGEYYDDEVVPAFASHVAPTFEALCRQWVLATRREATSVGGWWGRSVDALRATGERTTEEIDVIGMLRGRVSLIGECKWSAKPMSHRVLDDLEQFKIPALTQAGAKLASDRRIVLFAKAGFDRSLIAESEQRTDLELVDAATIVDGLTARA